jgi:hypothetical protein
MVQKIIIHRYGKWVKDAPVPELFLDLHAVVVLPLADGPEKKNDSV